MSAAFEKSVLSGAVLSYRCPRWKELPALELYMDQMTGYIAEVLRPLLDAEEERPLTKAMVNNYVKAHMIPRPVNKKYQREHLARLILLCTMKQVLSLPEARDVMKLAERENRFPQVYDYFCQQLENALTEVWNHPAKPRACTLTGEGEPVIDKLTYSFANKVYLQKRIAFEELGQRHAAEKHT